MQVCVKLFGPQASAAGRRVIVVDLPEGPLDSATVLQHAAGACPDLARVLGGCRIAVNHDFVGDKFSLRPADEVALIGQVSGG